MTTEAVPALPTDVSPLDRDLAAELADAIAAGDLEVHYQPIIDLRSGVAVRLEALVRWPSSGLGPNVFVGAAELAGTVFDLDLTVFEQVLADLAGWSFGGVDTCVAVNFSPITVLDGSCLPVMVGLLAAHGVEVSAVSIEITETALVDPDKLAAAAAELRAIGFRVALDDFGTRHSVLEHLRVMPADVVKIDRAFVAELPDVRCRIIIDALVQLAHALDLEVVAEGVETGEQADAMRAMGCETAQGWFFSKPVPAADAMRALALRHPTESVPARLFEDGGTPCRPVSCGGGRGTRGSRR